MSQQVVGVYEDERERWLENQNSLRALRVREILAANKTIDVDAATTSIRYPLRWHHLGLVMWYPDAGAEGDELARLQRFLRDWAKRSARMPVRSSLPPTKLWVGLAAVSRRDRRCQLRGFASFALQSSRFTESGDWVHGRRRRGFPPVTPGGGKRPRRRDRQRRQFVEPEVVAATDPGLAVVSRLGGSPAQSPTPGTGWPRCLATSRPMTKTTRGCGRRCGCFWVAAELQAGRRGAQPALQLGEVSRGRVRSSGVAARSAPGDRLDVELALLACHWYGSRRLAAKDPKDQRGSIGFSAGEWSGGCGDQTARRRGQVGGAGLRGPAPMAWPPVMITGTSTGNVVSSKHGWRWSGRSR